ncbi:MAG: LysM peptidoglycan-binding domain-containing protein, partial [Acidimicrobiales bacterium]
MIARVAPPLALVAVMGVAQVWVAPTAASAGTRTVAAGETLSGVAASLGVSVTALAHANGITDIHRVRAGRSLVVPA